MIDIKHIKTVKNYAKMQGVSTSYIYRMIREQRLTAIDIDGVLFIDYLKHKSLK